MINVEIDAKAGFCGGVIRAIGQAEKFLSSHKDAHLYSLGEIVHNESEIGRLSKLGLVALDAEDLNDIEDASGEHILIRAHGQPPKTYDTLRYLGFQIIDCTCPVVLGIQRKIREARGTIIIFGKKGHPEVMGLLGQVNEDRVRVIENYDDAVELLENEPDPGETEVFSQTTMSPVEYGKVCELFKNRLAKVKIHNTICKQVASRHAELEEFARKHDVIIFVSGKSSSNGRILSAVCKKANIRSYQVGSINEIQPVWFRPEDKVGVSGATSTPRWLLEEVAEYISKLQ